MINLYYGPVINPQTLIRYLALPRCLIAVGSNGNIIWIEEDVEASALPDIIAQHGLNDGDYTILDLSKKSGEFIMPGLIDTHVHACQFPNLGIGGDREILEWLLEYVFPTEFKFGDNAYAECVYNDVVNRSIACGTTTSCYYGSLHLDSTILLANIVQKKGQRAFVGKCNMDQDSPNYYIEATAEASLKETITLIEYIQGFPPSPANEPLVHPIITPRFALSCSDKLLTSLGELAKSLPRVSIQTHISENRKEVEETLKRFGAESYAEIYDQFGLLRKNTILAHGVWLTEKEMDLIVAREAGVAHCPTSNFYLSSGMAKVGLMLDHGVKVGLGTDVGGGYNPSILYTIQTASATSKMVAVQAELDEERRQHRRSKHDRHGKHGKRGKHGKHTKDAHDRPDATSSSSDSTSSSSDSDSDGDQAEAARQRKHHGHHKHGERREEHAECRPHAHHKHDEHDEERADRPPHAHRHGHPHAHTHRRLHCCYPPTKGPFTDRKLQVATLLYLATLGGAGVCGLEERIGSFAIGKAFDAIHARISDDAGNPAVWGRGIDENEANPEEKNVRRWLERFLFGGDNRNVSRVFVQGVVIGGAEANVAKVGKE